MNVVKNTFGIIRHILPLIMVVVFIISAINRYKSNDIQIDLDNEKYILEFLNNSHSQNKELENYCFSYDNSNRLIEYNFKNNDNCSFYTGHTYLKTEGSYKFAISYNDDTTKPKIILNQTNQNFFSTSKSDKLARLKLLYDINQISFSLKTREIKDSLRDNISISQIDKLIQKLNYSNISFNTPKELFLNEEHPLVLLASNGLTKLKLEKRLDSILGKNNIDKIEAHKIKASALIEAQLTGENFSVTSGSPVRQPLSGFDITKWEWIVEPKVKGNKVLTLTVNAVLNNNGREMPYTIQTFNKKIKVKVKNSVWYWVKENETLIIGLLTLIVTLLAVYYGYYLGKKSKENNIEEKKTSKKKRKKKK